MIFVNFKTYKEGTGEEAVELAKICQEVENETSIKIVPVVQAADISKIADLGIEVWSQAVFAPGATGVLLNHSDYRLTIEAVGEEARRIKNLESRIMICTESIEEGKKIAKFKPDFLAYEPPELIGRASPEAMPAARGDVSVSSAKPEIIRDFVLAIPGIPLVIGAGIHSQQDIQVGLKLGAKGFLVSSAVVLARNPKEKLLELAEGFR